MAMINLDDREIIVLQLALRDCQTYYKGIIESTEFPRMAEMLTDASKAMDELDEKFGRR